jgi:hypothetical protein
MSPGDVIRWQCPKFPNVIHDWRVIGVHLGAVGQESLIEMESLTHSPGWTGEWEFHPRLFVPEVLLRGLQVDPT